jgi:hypothetical protein
VRVLLQGNEGSLEERVINDVALAAFSGYDPFPAFCIDETKIGGNRFRFIALHGVYDYWSQRAIHAHNDPRVIDSVANPLFI